MAVLTAFWKTAFRTLELIYLLIFLHKKNENFVKIDYFEHKIFYTDMCIYFFEKNSRTFFFLAC